jgi:hypothetical protein
VPQALLQRHTWSLNNKAGTLPIARDTLSRLTNVLDMMRAVMHAGSITLNSA